MTGMPIGAYDRFEVVAIPFPFTESERARRRPALVLSSADSFSSRIGHSVMAMITSAENEPWPLDVEIRDLRAAGLPARSIVRMKLFTIDHRLIVKKLGSLSAADGSLVLRSLRALFEL
ncbi:MAG: type II toxin-antitoxin system PemK/MazF family toxin [Acidobacteria bacterium]|nr:type II toxin-antitoxin system PemK/MazF family toxin [Acidobacteriota bacterium]